MPTFFQKPENALKRADEFIEVSKPEQALEVLKDFIKSKKHRQWQKTHEPIMLRYLGLCVDLKKSYDAKEGLYQYKNICQLVNVKSLDTVVRQYLQTAEERTEAARTESHENVDDVDDLAVLQSPESLLLAAVSAEDAHDRSDRAILTPWVKFLWESYRQCLELLRNNNRVERLYHDLAKQAFEFCLKYTRKTEFRKLCDNLRNHLKNIIDKTHTPQNAVQLSNSDTLSMHLETRLAQLDYAIKMELWQEAFKAVEDIHDLIIRSKKVPKPSLLANYFEKFGLVFWKSGNKLFHSAACHRLFLLFSEQKKNPSPEEMTRMANRMLCATLAIPIPPTRYSIDQLLESNEGEKRRKLAGLLSLPVPPTRNSLIKDLTRSNVLQHASPELKRLYNLLEVEFDPLNLSSNIMPSVQFVEQQEELKRYVTSIQEMAVIRLIKQVAQIYQTIEFGKLRELAPFVSAFELEKIIVQAAKNIDLPVRLNHSQQTVSFGTDLNVCLQEEVEEGPFLQHMPGEQLRNQLQYMARALTSALNKLNVEDTQAVEARQLKMKIMETFKKTEERERTKILNRKYIIEDRKEQLEHASRLKTEEEASKEAERSRQLRLAEEQRLRKEMDEREKQRAQQEHENIRRKEAEKRIEQLKTTDVGQRALEGLSERELAELDTDEIMMKQVEQLEKEKKELHERLKNQEKKIDYFIRAKHLEEIPLLEENTKDKSVARREQWDQQEQARIESLKKERTLAMEHRDRLRRMLPCKDAFLAQLREERHGEHLERLKAFEVTLEQARAERLAERREARKRERKERAIKERQERIQRERDEEIRREREERLRREREEEEERKRREEELQAAAAKQRAREAEIEEKMMRQREEERQQNAPAAGWREREKAKQASWRKKDMGDDYEGSPRDEGRWGPSRDGPSRDGPPRDGPSRGPPRDDWKRDDRRDTRRDFRDDPRDRDSNYPRREDDRWSRGGPPNDDFRRDDFSRRDMGRDERDYGRRDMGGPPRDRGGRGFDDGGSSWRSGPPTREDKWDRGPSRRDERPREDDRYGRRDDGPPRRDDGPSRRDDRDWGRREEPEDRWGRRDGPPRRDERRDAPKEDGPWRKGAPVERKEAPAPSRQERPGRAPGDDDGWNTVRYNK